MLASRNTAEARIFLDLHCWTWWLLSIFSWPGSSRTNPLWRKCHFSSCEPKRDTNTHCLFLYFVCVCGFMQYEHCTFWMTEEDNNSILFVFFFPECCEWNSNRLGPVVVDTMQGGCGIITSSHAHFWVALNFWRLQWEIFKTVRLFVCFLLLLYSSETNLTRISVWKIRTRSTQQKS